ncbi:MAG: IS200/IS605 family transposase [Phycisphaerae bacterium]
MPRNVYSEINLHFVWRTKESRFLIAPALERNVYEAIVHRARMDEGVCVHGIGGTANHVHMAVTVPPTIEVSRWIGRVKGGSAHDINELPAFAGAFQWQTGYGVVSFGSRALPWVKAYIRDQKQHHENGTWQERLERIVRDAAEAGEGKGVETP